MKYYFYAHHVFLIAFVLIVFACSSKGTNGMTCANPIFEDTIYNFGVVDTASPILRHNFTFTNTGSAPFVILAAEGSCDCTTGEYEKRPIQPGETSTVTVIYDATSYGETEFFETLRLTTNTSYDIYLNIEGEIRLRK